MSVRIVCKCSPQALLAKVRGVKDPESPWYYHALDGVWQADWHYPHDLEAEQRFKELANEEGASELQKTIRNYLAENSQKLTWEVNCPRKDCKRTMKGHIEDLVYLVQQALAEGVRTVVLDSEVLHEVGKETRSFTVYRNAETLEVLGYRNGTGNAHSGA